MPENPKPPRPIGTVSISWDVTNHERRERVAGHVACPECGEAVEMIDDTEEWRRGNDGRWHHNGYGPASGECCGLLIVDDFNGCRVYRLGDA